jgi:hypothetical protein
MSALAAFQQRRRVGAALLVSAAAAIQGDGLGLDAEVRALEALAERLEHGRFRVLLIGCFSAGKSTLVNALCGQPVLPVKVNPCTAVVTEVQWGATPAAEVHRAGVVDYLTIPEFLREYQLRAGEVSEAGAEVADRFSAIERAIVSWPLPLLRDGVALVDTPGLDDDPVRTQRTLASLPEADAVIVVLNASRFLSELERKILRQQLLPLGLTNLFFPVTMADLLGSLTEDPAAERARIVDRGSQLLGSMCVVGGQSRFSERFFLVDARGALRSRWDRSAQAPRVPVDAAALVTSGIPDFEASLSAFLIHERGRVEVERVIGSVRRLQREVERRSALDRATATATAVELRARQEALAPQFESLMAVSRRVGRVVDGFIARQQVSVWQDLRDFLAEVEEEVPDAVAGFDFGPRSGLDLLTPRGRERVEQQLREQFETWLAQRVARWQAEMTPRLQAALHGLRAQLAGEAGDFERLSQAIVADFTGGVRFAADPVPSRGPGPDPAERWVSVAMGAVFLSPATMAAGWSEGYEGALKGFGFWVAKVALATLLGPVGWAALLVYVLADAALLVVTGQGQLRRVRDQVASGIRGRLVARADEVRDEIARNVGEGLAPLRAGVVAAAEADAAALREQLEQTIQSRERVAIDAATRAAAWDGAALALADVDRKLSAIYHDVVAVGAAR